MLTINIQIAIIKIKIRISIFLKMIWIVFMKILRTLAPWSHKHFNS